MEYRKMLKRLYDAKLAAHRQGFEKTAEAFESLASQLENHHKALLEHLIKTGEAR
ncbi:hypothetical protein C8N43_2076 [Litoreibacter ponti]|uniref:Ferritin-like diiron domain-containing protein n=1 Tax=Litoreibacter ponti TaxID=1510457 RepID=A0A2T6BMW4_9RHOB|nr:hypothetical protein C8N43_2076 [Litoreibacter ponti]